jgi:eukaryotic-like serine/threonine-protein kinase
MDEKTSAFPIINNRYQILNTLANGGMSVIYRAKDIILDRIIALKILKKSLSENHFFQDRFRTEAKSSAKLTHPNIVTTYDFGIDKNRLFLVLEYIDGHDLKFWITNNKVSSVALAIEFISQASRGLAYAHQQGIVHCDIKSQNILVTEIPSIKITDFGISRALEDISRMEKENEVWASPYYVSPEQTQGLPPSPASDVYSLGVVMYEVFTGKLPFYGNDALELIKKHQSNGVISPKSINPSIPNSIENIILTAMEKNPSNRYKNGQEIFNALLSVNIPSIEQQPRINENISKSNNSNVEKIKTNKKIQTNIDWSTILLSFFAIVFIGGLIPFWIYIYFSIKR